MVALSIIAIVAISLSLVLYQYASYNSQKIADLATNEIRTNSALKAHDISKIIENKFHEVKSVLSTLATAPAINNAEHPRAEQIISIRQDSTDETTDAYFWLDKDGKLLWSSKFTGNQSLRDKYAGIDLSQQPYFTEPKKTGTTFYSSIIETQDAPMVYIAMPIVDTQQRVVVGDNNTETSFKGVVVVGIKTETVAEIVKRDVSQAFQSDVMLLDRAGTVMYSANQSSIGQNVFSPDYRSYIYSTVAPESKAVMDSILSDLSLAKSGSIDMRILGKDNTVSYSPISVGGINFLMLYVFSPHGLTTEVSLLIEQQRNISTVIITAIGAVAIGIGFVIVSWNGRLSSAVEERTQDLRRKTEELAKANEQLLIHGKLQREFINTAAHELRTPVQPLIGVTDRIRQDMNSKDKTEITRQELEMLERNATRLQRLSSEILEASRIESKSLKLNKELVNLNENIQNVIADVKSFIRSGQHVEMVFQPKTTENVVVVEADKVRLFEVLSNLLRNAIKFTKDGTIVVTLDTRDGQAVVSVRDAGKGIDPDIEPKLFEKFATTSEQGTGLGLFISKNLVEAHGGRIWAENNADGKGATFTFTLPLAKVKRI